MGNLWFKLSNRIPGFNEREEKELEGVELSNDNAEADKDGGGGEPALKDAVNRGRVAILILI